MPKTKLLDSPLNTVWKIRRKIDGKYSTGSGSYPSFNHEGKCFYSEKKLMNHLSMVLRYLSKYRKDRAHPYLGCEIVQFKLVEEVAIPFEGYGQ